VPTGKEQNVPGDFPHSAYDAVRARADLLGCVASRATVREQVPPRALRPNVDTTAAFILAIIPLDEVRIYIGDGAKPSQFTSLARPLEWASEHSYESQSFETLSESSRRMFATLSEGEVREPSVLARQTPGGFTVARQINYGKFVCHLVLFPTSGFSPNSVRQFPEPTPEDFQKIDKRKSLTVSLLRYAIVREPTTAPIARH
jgi:hypothetical protein